jgi:hypothetical protein
MMGQLGALSRSEIIFVTLFSAGAQSCCPFKPIMDVKLDKWCNNLQWM